MDWDAKVWNCPLSIMKNGRPRRVPLTPEAVAILERRSKVAKGGYALFPEGKAKLGDHVLRDTMRRVALQSSTPGKLASPTDIATASPIGHAHSPYQKTSANVRFPTSTKMKRVARTPAATCSNNVAPSWRSGRTTLWERRRRIMRNVKPGRQSAHLRWRKSGGTSRLANGRSRGCWPGGDLGSAGLATWDFRA